VENPGDKTLESEKQKLEAPSFDINSLLGNPMIQEMIKKNP
jgi:hypothetical protein